MGRDAKSKPMKAQKLLLRGQVTKRRKNSSSVVQNGYCPSLCILQCKSLDFVLNLFLFFLNERRDCAYFIDIEELKGVQSELQPRNYRTQIFSSCCYPNISLCFNFLHQHGCRSFLSIENSGVPLLQYFPYNLFLVTIRKICTCEGRNSAIWSERRDHL